MGVRFDASGDYYSRSSDVLDYNSTYTWMGYITVAVDQNALSSIFIIDDGSANSRDWLRLASDGLQLQLRVDNAGAGSSADNTVLSLNTPYHVALVRESATSLKVYLNGVLDSTNTTSNAGRPAATRMHIATRNNGVNPFNGAVAYGKAWTVALTADEVAAEMRSVRPISHLDSLYAWWPMRSGAGERAKDYAGLGRDWTENGTLTDEDGPGVWWGSPLQWIFGQGSGPTQFEQIVAGATTSAGGITRTTTKALSGEATSIGEVARLVTRLLSGATTSAGAIETAKFFLQLVAGATTSAGGLARTTTKALSGATLSAGALIRSVVRLLSGATTSSGALAATRVFLQAVAGATTSAGGLTRRATKGTAGATTSAGAVVRRAMKTLAGATTSSGAVRRLVTKLLAGATTSAGALTSGITQLIQPLAHLVYRVRRRLATFLVRGERTIPVPAYTYVIEAKTMAVADVYKDPGDAVPFTLDWATFLDGDSIATSAWAVETAGITIDDESDAPTTTTVKLSGGTAERKYKVKNTITTAAGLTVVRRLNVLVKEL